MYRNIYDKYNIFRFFKIFYFNVINGDEVSWNLGCVIKEL